MDLETLFARTPATIDEIRTRVAYALQRHRMHPVSTPGQEGAILAEDRLGSHGGLGLQVRLPIPGQQVGDFVGGVIWKPGQHVSKPSLRIDVVHLAGFDQGVDGGGTMTTSI